MALEPHDDQVRQQLGGDDVGVGREQAVEQLAHAQDTHAQLAGSEYHTDRDAVRLKMLVNRRYGSAAVVQAGAHAVFCLMHICRFGAVVQHGLAQVFYVADEGVKRLRVLGRAAHAQAQLGRKARGQNLSRTVGDAVEHQLLPRGKPVAIVGHIAHHAFVHIALGNLHGHHHRVLNGGKTGRQQGRQAVDGGGVQRFQPLGIKGGVQRHREQLGGVNRLGGRGQELPAQALGQLVEKGGAGCKAKISKQGG